MEVGLSMVYNSELRRVGVNILTEVEQPFCEIFDRYQVVMNPSQVQRQIFQIDMSSRSSIVSALADIHFHGFEDECHDPL